MYRTNKNIIITQEVNYRLIAFQIVLVKYNHLDNNAPFLAKIKKEIGTHHAIVK